MPSESIADERRDALTPLILRHGRTRDRAPSGATLACGARRNPEPVEAVFEFVRTLPPEVSELWRLVHPRSLAISMGCGVSLFFGSRPLLIVASQVSNWMRMM
jgi:hypothetical protein